MVNIEEGPAANNITPSKKLSQMELQIVNPHNRDSDLARDKESYI